MTELTGADIVGALLRAFDPLTAKVLPERIKGGRLPDEVALPALLVRTISAGEWQALKRPLMVRRTDRVSVTVRARNYDEQVMLIGLVRRCCAGQIGDIGGGSGVSILNAGTGPDVLGPADSFEQAQDFRVSFDADA